MVPAPPRSPLLLALAGSALLVVSCTAQDRLSSFEHQRLESQCADDFVALGDEAGALGSGASLALVSRGSWSECISGYAGCQRCYEVEGDSLGGSIAMELQGAPCSASITFNDLTLAYTITERSWSGTWVLLEDDWCDLAWEGAHTASLLIEGAGDHDGTYDSSLVLNRATAEADGDGNVRAWTMDYDYTGYLGRSWHVSAQQAEDGTLSGQVTSDTGIVCAISGQDYDLVLSCDD